MAVIGLGVFGKTIARELAERGAQVIALDERKEPVEEIREFVTYSVQVNSMDRNALRAIGVDNVDIAVVCIGDDIEANLLTTILLKKMGVRKVWSRAISPLQGEILKTLDVDFIMNIEEEMGRVTASSVLSRHIDKHIPLASGFSLAEISTPESFVGKTIQQIKSREKHNIIIVAIKKKRPRINELGEREFEEYIEDIPQPHQKLEENDVMIIMGAEKSIEVFTSL